MTTARLTATAAVMLFLLSIGSVFAQYRTTIPIISAVGAPALRGNQFVNSFNATYRDGSGPVVGAYPLNVQLRFCGSSGCAYVAVTLSESPPGTYSYSFTAPALVTGTVSIIIPAGTLTDPATGKAFPATDTVLGTYSAPGGAPGQSSPSSPAVGGLSPRPSGPYREAVATSYVAGQAVQTDLLVVVSVLIMACAGLMILRRRQGS